MDAVDVRYSPFAHTTAINALGEEVANTALTWFENDAPWVLRIADFYEQWELHLEPDHLPQGLKQLVDPRFVGDLARNLFRSFADTDIELLEITAHKLVRGQTIRIHNDFIEGAESHRILIQLNRDWHDDAGGLLMLFNSDDPADISRVIRPLSRTAFAFSINEKSFHAVSTIKEGARYTLVYSFGRKRPREN